MLGIHRTNKGKATERFMLSFVCIVTELVTIFTLGYFSANWYGKFLFSDWFAAKE